MSVTIEQFTVWLVVGLLAGSIAGILVRRERRGFGIGLNLALGLIGALVGGILFRLFGIWPDLDAFRVSLRDLVAAVGGSLLVLLMVWLWRRVAKSP